MANNRGNGRYNDEPVIFLSRNTRKRGRRDPDYTGTWREPDRPDCWASAWINERTDDDGVVHKYLRVTRGRPKDQTRRQGGDNPHPDERGTRGDYDMRRGPDSRYREGERRAHDDRPPVQDDFDDDIPF